MLLTDLQQIRIEILGLLERLSSQLPTSKERKVFIINNVDQMLQVFQERRVMSDEVQKLDDMLMHQRELFAEEALKDIFPRLVSFVLQVYIKTILHHYHYNLSFHLFPFNLI